MASYVKNRYKSAKFSSIVAQIINDMNAAPKSWTAPNKTVFKKRMNGKDITILLNSFDPERPVTLFVDMVEKDSITEKEMRILRAEFGYLRQKFEAYISKEKDKKKEPLFA